VLPYGASRSTPSPAADNGCSYLLPSMGSTASHCPAGTAPCDRQSTDRWALCPSRIEPVLALACPVTGVSGSAPPASESGQRCSQPAAGAPETCGPVLPATSSVPTVDVDAAPPPGA